MPPKACSKCAARAVYHAAYSGQHLCAEHFCGFVERRFRRELRKQGPFSEGAHLAVALSGGKDSVALLHLLYGVFGGNPRVRLTAVTVDEGIEAYRPPSIEVAADACRSLGVPHVVRSYREEAGTTMDEVVSGGAPGLPCAYCGPLRRRALNHAAREVGATHLATGHNLDDVAQSVLMNVLKGNVDALARMGPHPPEREMAGLVPRIQPLRLVPEREVALYAILKGYRYHDAECPYSREATRGRYRSLLHALEREDPGTRHALVAGLDRMAPALWAHLPGAPLGECARCGEPASGGVCNSCRLLESLRRPAMPPA